jgi:glycosyltransferase involved in cell wall biosynthesis
MMDNTVMVSVIVPLYNAEAYIESTLESILKQTEKRIEVICIDDVSTDGTVEICKRVMNRDKRISLLRNDINSGQEITRNKGLMEAKGKYVTFVDADDMIEEHMIEELLAIAESEKVEMVFATFSAVIGGTEEPNVSGVPSGRYSIKKFTEFILKDISWNIISCIGSKLYRKDFIEKYNLYFDKAYKFNEDCAYALAALLEAKEVYYQEKPYYKYMIRDQGSTMSSYRPNMLTSNTRVVELCRKLFEKCDLLEQKEIPYYEMVYQVYINSLLNEIKFGEKESFYRVFQQIRTHERFRQVFFASKLFGMKHRMMMLLIYARLRRLSYIFLKVYTGKAIK